jgi:hypothetical protein
MTSAENQSTKSSKDSSPVPLWMWGAVAALLLFAIYLLWETIQVKKKIEATNGQMKAEIANRHKIEEEFGQARREAILIDPRSVKIRMVPASMGMPRLETMWNTGLGIVVTGQNVPMPRGNRTLQLWFVPKVAGGKPTPSWTLRPEADGNFVLLVANPPATIDATKTLFITEEPAGGSPQPTTKPIWVGTIS